MGEVLIFLVEDQSGSGVVKKFYQNVRLPIGAGSIVKHLRNCLELPCDGRVLSAIAADVLDAGLS